MRFQAHNNNKYSLVMRLIVIEQKHNKMFALVNCKLQNSDFKDDNDNNNNNVTEEMIRIAF